MRRRYPLHIHISSCFLTLILVVCVVLGGIGYRLSSGLLERSATELTAAVSREALLEMRRVIEAAEVATRLLSLQDVTTARSLRQRLDSLDFLRQALDSSSALSALYVGYDNGDFFLLGRVGHGSAAERSRAPVGALTSCRASSAPGPRRGAFHLFRRAPAAAARGRPPGLRGRL
jgi:hypothetical protein